MPMTCSHKFSDYITGTGLSCTSTANISRGVRLSTAICLVFLLLHACSPATGDAPWSRPMLAWCSVYGNLAGLDGEPWLWPLKFRF